MHTLWLMQFNPIASCIFMIVAFRPLSQFVATSDAMCLRLRRCMQTDKMQNEHENVKNNMCWTLRLMAGRKCGATKALKIVQRPGKSMRPHRSAPMRRLGCFVIDLDIPMTSARSEIGRERMRISVTRMQWLQRRCGRLLVLAA